MGMVRVPPGSVGCHEITQQIWRQILLHKAGTGIGFLCTLLDQGASRSQQAWRPVGMAALEKETCHLRLLHWVERPSRIEILFPGIRSRFIGVQMVMSNLAWGNMAATWTQLRVAI